MSENLFGQLHGATTVASTGSATIFGVEVGLVTNVQDPQKLGRVKVCFPRLSGLPESDWARVVQPAGGPGRGFYWLPEVNDEVLVAFEMGQPNRPFVIRCLWNAKDKPMKDAYADDNTTRMIQTKSGHQITLSDKDGEEKITICDGTEKRVLTFDVKAKKLLIEAKEGCVELRAKKKIVMACEDLEVRARKDAKFDVAKSLDLKIASDGAMEAGSTFTLKGSQVQINPSSLSVAALAGAAARALAGAAAGPAKGAAAGAGAGGPGGAGGGVATRGAGGGPGGGALGSDVLPSSGGAASPGAAPGAGAGTAGAGASPAAAAAVAADELDVQLVSIAGTPQAQVEVELTLPNGDKQAGKTDSGGHFKLARLAAKGNAKLDVPDVQVAPAAPASTAGRLRFVQGGIDVPIGQASVVELPPRVRRCRMKGMHFETAKTFLLPSAMTGIRMLVKLYKSFKGIVGLVNGHTDKQGSADYNRGLSRERADSIKAFLIDDPATWMKWYGTMPNSNRWGVREDQHMLSTVQDKDGAPFLSPPRADGNLDAATRDAYRSFQRSRLLTETGSPDGDTRLELVRAYMALDGTSLESGSPLETHGCGLTHPLPETAGDPNPNQPANRRVEVFLFEEKVDPSPRTPCPSAGCEEYDKWVAQKILDVDLDQPPGAIAARVAAEDGSPVPGAEVHASGPLVLDGTSAADGTVPGFDDIIPGSYKVIAQAAGFLAADVTVSVPPGGTADAQLILKGDVSLANPRVTPQQVATEEFSIRLLGLRGEPCGNCEATVVAGNARAFGTSDQKGVLKVQLPKGTKDVTVTYAPADAQSLVSWPVRLGLGPVDTEEGAVGRLLNLGYPADTDRSFALFTFQADHDIGTTVQLDAATKAKLVEVHGG